MNLKLLLLFCFLVSVQSQYWTYVSGYNETRSTGTQGVGTSTTTPGSRAWASSGKDRRGNIWVFGGVRPLPAGLSPVYQYLADLWKYDPRGIWTYVSGALNYPQTGTGNYGAKGVSSPLYYPPMKWKHSMWIDSTDSVWIFGGDNGFGNNVMNDLWRFSAGSWTWLSGTISSNTAGVYGTLGVPALSNTPGGRKGAASWIDENDRLWLFGGDGVGADVSDRGYLNDLWMFDRTQWTWMSGGASTSNVLYYGIPGISSSGNVIGGRTDAAAWYDKATRTAYVFGGYGYATNCGGYSYLNDLWKYKDGNWTWIGGSPNGNSTGSYGTKGVASPTNWPPGLANSLLRVDNNGKIWLFGGETMTTTMNDLWKFDGQMWTWMTGSASTSFTQSVKGTPGVPAPTNSPSGRASMAGWIDGANNLCTFGGTYGGSELWKYSII